MKMTTIWILIAMAIFSGAELRASEYEDARAAIMTPLYAACVRGDADQVYSMIKAGSDVNARNGVPDRKYRKMFAEESETPLFAAIRAGKYSVVGILLDNGAAVNVRAPHSGTPLHLAADIAVPDIARALLEKGADVNAMAVIDAARFSDDTGNGGNTLSPLHVLVIGARDDPERMMSRVRVAKMLIDGGADVNIREPVFGRTPLHCAVQYRRIELVKVLVENGADVNARETGEFSDATPLYYAMGSGNDVIEEYLRAHGAESGKSRTTAELENAIARERFSSLVKASLTLGIPLAYLGASIYLYERKFRDDRGSNMMGTFNAYAGATFACAAAGLVIGCVITPSGEGFLGGLNKLVGGFFGAVIGVPVGMAVAHYTHLPRKTKRSRALYYGPPAASMMIPLIAFSTTF